MKVEWWRRCIILLVAKVSLLLLQFENSVFSFFHLGLTVWGSRLVFACGRTPYGKWTFRDLVVANFCPSSLRNPSCRLPRNISVSSLTVGYANNPSHLAGETWVTIMSRNFEPLCHLKSCNRPKWNVKKLVSGRIGASSWWILFLNSYHGGAFNGIGWSKPDS